MQQMPSWFFFLCFPFLAPRAITSCNVSVSCMGIGRVCRSLPTTCRYWCSAPWRPSALADPGQPQLHGYRGCKWCHVNTCGCAQVWMIPQQSHGLTTVSGHCQGPDRRLGHFAGASRPSPIRCQAPRMVACRPPPLFVKATLVPKTTLSAASVNVCTKRILVVHSL